jgi:shikimate kinase
LPSTKEFKEREAAMQAARSESQPNPTETAPTTLPVDLKRIVLTGFMGAGKSSVGRLLAEQLGWAFLDLDAHLEARAGCSVADIFALHGETHFRRLESSALANALSRTGTVIALGGGTPEQLTNRLLLEQTPGTMVIFLEASFETLFDRCMLQSFASPEHIRPVLASPEEAAARFAARQPMYRRLARLTVATAELTPVEAAEQIAQELARR